METGEPYNNNFYFGGMRRGHRAMIDSPPLPISSDFFSTFIDVSGSDPRSLIKF
jgi:hypothetical protein